MLSSRCSLYAPRSGSNPGTALQYSSTPALQHSSTPALQHSSTPVLQYSSTPVLQYSSTPVLQYSSTPALHLRLNLQDVDSTHRSHVAFYCIMGSRLEWRDPNLVVHSSKNQCNDY